MFLCLDSHDTRGFLSKTDASFQYQYWLVDLPILVYIRMVCARAHLYVRTLWFWNLGEVIAENYMLEVTTIIANLQSFWKGQPPHYIEISTWVLSSWGGIHDYTRS